MNVELRQGFDWPVDGWFRRTFDCRWRKISNLDRASISENRHVISASQASDWIDLFIDLGGILIDLPLSWSRDNDTVNQPACHDETHEPPRCHISCRCRILRRLTPSHLPLVPRVVAEIISKKGKA